MNIVMMKRRVVRVVRGLLDLVNIDPALIKAMIRTPPTVHGGPRARRWPWPRRRHFDTREACESCNC